MSTDVRGWIEGAPYALAALLVLFGICGLLENTDRGRRLMDAALRWLER